MKEYDLYINAKKPSVGLYVPKGAYLPDLSDKSDWIFDGTASEDILPADVIDGVRDNGHAFRNMN